MTDNKFAEIEQYVNGTSSDKVIEIRSVYSKESKHKIEPAWDESISWFAGVDRLSDEEKKERPYYVKVQLIGDKSKENTTITLKHGYTFNLNKEKDKIDWEWAKHLPCLEMSFKRAQMSKASFYVHIEGQESEKKNKETVTMYEAMKLVMEDSTSNYENRALLLGVDMSGEPLNNIKEFLLEVASKTPGKLSNVYRDKIMKLKLLYAQAKRAGVIKFSGDEKVVKYGEVVLGINEDAAIAWLQNNTDILDLLEREINPGYYARKENVAVTALDVVKAEKEKNGNTPSYPYLKKAAVEAGYTGSQKKDDLIAYFESSDVSLESLYEKEKAEVTA